MKTNIYGYIQLTKAEQAIYRKLKLFLLDNIDSNDDTDFHFSQFLKLSVTINDKFSLFAVTTTEPGLLTQFCQQWLSESLLNTTTFMGTNVLTLPIENLLAVDGRYEDVYRAIRSGTKTSSPSQLS